ncbi:hypothetical protein BABINDRAFT_160939 [Babjeviella inositovora NRRL Y-12698]|uniref:Protein FMP42 n=1 Tax=Babjeviella inositovora NRRL Y-12698 TaxID=984486 RepID=A0A1E3QSR5_9ASCO|nr:uncharacterized protein BABINDRAFT_160939 [Babjeviella inositovora NRRL Y-12698]ODQ80710.1 hypothetical protein BABINDRAFT_160939 [Babjeviella inositovora NRRL Y-12698]
MPAARSSSPLNRRYLQVGCSIVWCLLAAGPIFGFAALKPVLIEQGVYYEKCNVDVSLSSLVTHGSSSCTEQDLALNFMFTLAAVVTNVTALLVGAVLDRYGPRVSGIIGSALLAMASALFINGKSFTASENAFISLVDPYLCGYTVLALGGPFCFISSFHLANAFPQNLGLVLALLTGAFDSSSALFLGYRLVYTHFIEADTHLEISLSDFFKFYLIVPLFIFGCQLFVMPHESYKLESVKKTAGETTSLLVSLSDVEEQAKPDPSRRASIAVSMVSSSRPGRYERRFSTISQLNDNAHQAEIDYEAETSPRRGGVYGILHGSSIKEQLSSLWFVIMTLFTTIQMLRINYFVATLKTQEDFLFEEETALKLNHFFDLALPLGGLISIPFIGLILDNLATGPVMLIITVVSVVIGVFGLLNQSVVYPILGMLLLVVYRPFYYTVVSDFVAKVFGHENFGTVYGTIICISGCMNLVQPLLDRLTHEKFGMNPTPVNVGLVSLTGILGTWLLLFIKQQENGVKRRHLELEAENALEFDIPS